MCYDISFKVKIEQLTDYFPGLIFDEEIEVVFESIDHIQGVALFGEHPIIYMEREDRLPHCRKMEWSCIEFYAKEEPDFRKRNSMLNIRSERILADPKSYWYKIRNRRCLIPVSGVYEHRLVRGWKKKVPYHIKPFGQAVFFLPGLYSVAELPDRDTGEMIKRYTFGLITRAANELMKNIHNDGENKWRMPLFLPLELSKQFLSEELTEEEYKKILAYEIPSEDLDHYPVNTIRTGKPRPDYKEKHEPWEWPKLPPLGEMNPEYPL
jgi:putative SOS response-associated peptidase YedK